MQETIKSQQQWPGAELRQFATSQRDTALQLTLSHLGAGLVALGMYFGMEQLRLAQPYPLLLALVAGCLAGLLGTLNLQYGLYLLEITLSHLAHDALTSEMSEDEYQRIVHRRWPLVPLFTRLRETARRVHQYAANELLTSDLRAQALQQAGAAAAQAERNRIARELHDSIKQQIFSISVSAAAAQAHWQSAAGENARAAVEDIQRSAKEAQVEMQALLQQLRPAPLENTSLVDALHIQAQALGFRTGAQVQVEIGALPGPERLLPGTQEAIFRLVQEAFANIARHARAGSIWLTLSCTETSLRVEVRDDGQGFAPAKVRAGMGLNNLRERARELHGQTEISSQPGQGTSVTITLPLLHALSNPEEEIRRKYRLTRASDLAKRGYQLGENTAILGIALVSLAALLKLHWSVVILSIIVSLYGYLSGNYYRLQVALQSEKESRITLDLKQQRYRAFLNLARLWGFGLWYGFDLLGLRREDIFWWLLLGVFLALVGYVQIARRRFYLDTERYFALLSPQELPWELNRRLQGVTRSLTLWFIACTTGLITTRAYFMPLLPFTTAKQTAYGVALLLLIIGIGLASQYVQIQSWRRTLNTREQSASLETDAQEG